MADKTTYQFATTDMLLKSIRGADKTRMTTLLESAGDDPIWNINKKDIKAGGLEWPKLKKVTKKGVAPQTSPIVILTDTVAFSRIKRNNFSSGDLFSTSNKTEFKFLKKYLNKYKKYISIFYIVTYLCLILIPDYLLLLD